MVSSGESRGRRLGALFFLLSTALGPVRAQLQLNICASFNTADMGRNVSIYQTNGLCSDFCRDQYAYSITQDEACWCSDYTPSKSSQVDMDRCDITCPAFPPERCGGRGLYGYVELDGKLPEGTKGPQPSSTAEPSSTTTSEEPSSTEEPTSTEPTSTSTSTSTTSTTSSESSTSEESTSTTSMLQTLTSDGTVTTVTVTPSTDTDSDDADEGNETQPAQPSESSGGGNSGLSTGGIVGIVIGIVGAMLIAGGAVFLWFYKRRKRERQNGYEDDPSVRGDSSDRMGSAHPEMAMGAGGNSPVSNLGSGSNRNSTLAIDPRMDPFKQGLYMRNGSQESINTLRDDHDYSRRIQQPKVLRATNPDPDNGD